MNADNIQLTSQKNSFPRSPQNQDIHDTSSELLMFLTSEKYIVKCEHPLKNRQQL